MRLTVPLIFCSFIFNNFSFIILYLFCILHPLWPYFSSSVFHFRSWHEFVPLFCLQGFLRSTYSLQQWCVYSCMYVFFHPLYVSVLLTVPSFSPLGHYSLSFFYIFPICVCSLIGGNFTEICKNQHTTQITQTPEVSHNITWSIWFIKKVLGQCT